VRQLALKRGNGACFLCFLPWPGSKLHGGLRCAGHAKVLKNVQ